MEKIMQTLRNVFLLLLLATGVQAQHANRLSIPDLTGAEGTTINLPVNLDNTGADIVAMQFDLTVPDGVLALDPDGIALSERCGDHTVVASERGDGVYRVMVYSPTNQPFKANSGTIMDIGAAIGRNLDESAAYPLELSGVVLSDAEGKNVATASSGGTFKVLCGLSCAPNNALESLPIPTTTAPAVASVEAAVQPRATKTKSVKNKRNG